MSLISSRVQSYLGALALTALYKTLPSPEGGGGGELGEKDSLTGVLNDRTASHVEDWVERAAARLERIGRAIGCGQ